MNDVPGRSVHVAIVGSGAWGTTLALLAHRAGQRVSLLVRDPVTAEQVRADRHRPRGRSGPPLPPEIDISSEPRTALAPAEIVLIAVPVQAMREVIRKTAQLTMGKVVVSCAKGLEIATLQRPTQIIGEELSAAGVSATVCALSGPNLAMEIAAGKPASTVVASNDPSSARVVQAAMTSSRFRVYTNSDVVGVEMAGALKNILAIGAGIADGLNAGDNAKAAFLTRGIAEIARLGIACGAQALTFAGLAGIGDVTATCASPLSRNHRVGAELASGRSLDEILVEMDEVAEGVPTTKAAVRLGRSMDVPIPITEQMHDVLFASKSPLTAIAELMARDPTDEMSAFR